MKDPIAPDIKGNRQGYLPAMAVAALLAAAFASIKVFEPDMWWHLAGGRLVANGSFPTLNTFSHTHPTHPWVYTQWLFGVVLYVIERVGGIVGLEGFQVLLVVASFLLTLDTAWLRQRRPALLPLMPLFVLALAASRFRFVPRPHLVTFVGLSLLLNLWTRKIKGLPLVFFTLGVVWANSHAGVAFGLAAIAGMVVASLLARNKEEVRLSLAGFGAFLLGTLCNPGFFYPYVYSFGHLSVNKIVALEEFQRPSLAINMPFFVYAGLALAALPFRLRKREFLYPVLAVMFLPLALDAMRVIPKFILVTLPGVCRSAWELWEWLLRKRRGAVVAAAILGSLSAAAIFLAVRDYRGREKIFPFGWGENSRLLPVGAARFVQDKDLDGRIFNDFETGGYLEWRLYPGRKVFQDGRVQAYPPEFFQEIFGVRGSGEWSKLMEKYGVDYAVVTRRPFTYKVDLGGLFEAMGWQLVYLDGISYVYVKPGSVNSARTQGDRFVLIGANNKAEELFARAGQAPAEMIGELGRIRPETLLDPYDFYRFGMAAFAAGSAASAETFFRLGLAQFPDNVGLRVNLGYLFARTGRRREAREEFGRAAAEGKGTGTGAEAMEQLKNLGNGN